MSAGRCAGCGKVDTSCKVVRGHVRTCADFRALYRSDPSKALDPEAEYRRWFAEDKPQEDADHDAARLARKGERIDAYNDRVAQQVVRWATPPDLLE